MIARAASDAPARSSSLSSLLLSVATMSAMMSRAWSRSAGVAAAHFALALCQSALVRDRLARGRALGLVRCREQLAEDLLLVVMVPVRAPRPFGRAWRNKERRGGGRVANEGAGENQRARESRM